MTIRDSEYRIKLQLFADGGPNNKKRMTEEEKKKKFGDKYDPNFKPGRKREDNGPTPEKDSHKCGEHREDNVPPENNYTFYVLTEQIAKDSANFGYQYLPGVAYNAGKNTVTFDSASGEVTVASTPSSGNQQLICAINYYPYHGLCQQKTSGLNLAAQELFTFVRNKVSGSRTYQGSDQMMYILGASDVFTNILEAKRILRCAKLYDRENRSLPNRLALSMGITSAQLKAIQDNMANLRAALNVRILRTNSLAIPKYFKLFLRRAYVASNVFTDSSSVRGQYYVMIKNGYLTFSGTSNTNGSELVYSDFPSTTATYGKLTKLLNAIDAQLDVLLSDSDTQTIAGDLLHAFGSDKLYSMSELGEGDMQEVIFDEDILSQIENIKMWSDYRPSGATTSTLKLGLNVSQLNAELENDDVKNVIISGIKMFGEATATSAVYAEKILFNSHKDNPDYRDNIEWSRMTAVAVPLSKAENPAQGIQNLGINCGTELVDSINLYTVNGVETITSTKFATNTPLSLLMALVQYDWHPIMYRIITGTNGATEYFGDLKVWTLLSHADLSQLHDRCNEALVWDTELYKAQQKPAK